MFDLATYIALGVMGLALVNLVRQVWAEIPTRWSFARDETTTAESPTSPPVDLIEVSPEAFEAQADAFRKAGWSVVRTPSGTACFGVVEPLVRETPSSRPRTPSER